MTAKLFVKKEFRCISRIIVFPWYFTVKKDPELTCYFLGHWLLKRYQPTTITHWKKIKFSYWWQDRPRVWKKCWWRCQIPCCVNLVIRLWVFRHTAKNILPRYHLLTESYRSSIHNNSIWIRSTTWTFKRPLIIDIKEIQKGIPCLFEILVAYLVTDVNKTWVHESLHQHSVLCIYGSSERKIIKLSYQYHEYMEAESKIWNKFWFRKSQVSSNISIKYSMEKLP